MRGKREGQKSDREAPRERINQEKEKKRGQE